jgi:hypothetical protein
MPVILQVSQSNATTDMNGMASIVPSGVGFSAPLEVDVGVTAGAGALLDYPLIVLPAPDSGSTNSPPSSVGRLPVRIRGPIRTERVNRPAADNVQ